MRRTAKAKSSRRIPILRSALICLVTYLGLFAMLYSGITPEQYDIQVGVPSPTHIKATKDIQDTVTTEALREEAANAVEPSYKSADPTVIDAVMGDLTARFTALQELHDGLTAEQARSLDDTELAGMNDKLSMSLSREQIAALAETSDETLGSVFTDASGAVREVLEATLPEGQEANAIKTVRNDLSQRYSAQLTGIITEAVRGCLRPNMLIDEEITGTNRDKARESVQPVMYVKDQTIVSEGEVVTLAQYTMISSMGILSENSFDLHMFGGVALLILLMMLSLGVYLYHYNRAMLLDTKSMLLLSLILLLHVGCSLLFRIVNSYLMPVSLGLLLVALLIDTRLAIFVNVILSLLTSLFASTASGMFSVSLMSLLCSPIIALLFSHKTLRTTTLLAGVMIATVNFLTTTAYGLFNSAEMYTVMLNALWAAGGGMAGAILCIAIQPLLEWVFNLATASKLIELSNPNQPLLRRLLLEASGTYHHSIIVANLAEAGCTAIGANGLLARVGAYYHDIGKLKRPMYFKENQMGDNPHDRTDPRVSTAILTAHTRDGVQLAQKARIPQPVVDIIRQHHGDAPVIYFYDKAMKLYGDQTDISAFRYEGPRPQSREAAVVMLADTIEAATRALPNPDPEKIDALIRKLVRGKLNDGQLDNSSLTFNDLDKICSAFSTVLTGVFHERIEYPEVNIPPRAEQNNASEDKPAMPESAAQGTAGNGQTTTNSAPSIAGNTQPAANSAQSAMGNAQTTVNSAPSAGSPVAPGRPVPPVREAAEQSTQPATGNAQPIGNSAPSAGSPVAPGRPVPPVRETAEQSAQPAASGVQPATGNAQTAVNSAPSAGSPVAPGRPVSPVREAAEQSAQTAASGVQPATGNVQPIGNSTPPAGNPVAPGRPVPPVREAAEQSTQPATGNAQPIGNSAPSAGSPVAPGRPVPPVRETAEQSAQPAASGVQPATGNAQTAVNSAPSAGSPVAPGRPVPPVREAAEQSAQTAASGVQPATGNVQPIGNSTPSAGSPVAPGRPVPPVREADRPAVSAGTPVPPVRPGEAEKEATAGGH